MATALSQSPGDTCDINADFHPTFVADAHTLEGVPVENYDLILADPPYSAEDADHYGTPLVNRNKVVETPSERMARGAHLAWLDQSQPMYAKAGYSRRRRSAWCARPTTVTGCC